MKRGIFVGVAAIALISAAVFYFMVDPMESKLAPKCFVHVLTGLDCPGCGSQRALHALLHGDVQEAWRHNALLVALVPVISVTGVSELSRRKNSRFHDIIHNPLTGWVILGVIILWTIIRNIPGLIK